LNKVIDELRPGYTLLVKQGTYRLPNWDIKDLHGTAEAPINIKAEPGTVIEGFSQAFSVLRMEDVSYVNFQNFEIRSSAQTLGGIDGIRITGRKSHHINLNNLNIHDVSGRGIKVSALEASHIKILDSTIYNCDSSGITLGYPEKYIVHDSVVQNNYIHHCPKDKDRKAYYGIQIREGSFANIIKNNVLHDIGSKNKAGITVYYGPNYRSGNPEQKVNKVQDNILWNIRNQAITAISNAFIENNVVFNTNIGFEFLGYSNNSAIENGVIENLIIRDNSVFSCKDECVRIKDWEQALNNVKFLNNFIYQNQPQKYALKGIAGKGVFKNNVYYGLNEIKKGFSLATENDFVKMLSLTHDPEIEMSASLEKSLSQAISGIKRNVDYQQKTNQDVDDDVKSTEELKEEAEIKKEKEKQSLAEEKNNKNNFLTEVENILTSKQSLNLNPEIKKIIKKLLNETKIKEKIKNTLFYFVQIGTKSTRTLGAGERAGVVDSFRNAFGHFPQTENDWQDVIKIANGSWPDQKNSELEERIKNQIFKKIYKRKADMEKPHDNAAVTIIAYGLRPSDRNSNSEKEAIKTFKHVYGRAPQSAQDWNIIRSIAYSGAKK